LQRIRVRDVAGKILVVHHPAIDRAGAEKSLHEDAAGVIDAGEGFPRNRILAFEGDAGSERAGAIEERLRRADRAGAEPDPGSGLHLPIGADRGRLPGRHFRRHSHRQRDAFRAPIEAGEAVVEAESQDVGGEIAGMGKRLRRGAGGQIA
jgi:hypothetical protein